MGGHGALTLALRHPGLFRRSRPSRRSARRSQCPWGEKAFSGYLGADTHALARRTTPRELMERSRPRPSPAASWSTRAWPTNSCAEQLHPKRSRPPAAPPASRSTLRRHAGYDHGYYFISSFIDDHLAHHAKQLAGACAATPHERPALAAPARARRDRAARTLRRPGSAGHRGGRDGAGCREAAGRAAGQPRRRLRHRIQADLLKNEVSGGPHMVQFASLDGAWLFQLHRPDCRAAART